MATGSWSARVLLLSYFLMIETAASFRLGCWTTRSLRNLGRSESGRACSAVDAWMSKNIIAATDRQGRVRNRGDTGCTGGEREKPALSSVETGTTGYDAEIPGDRSPREPTHPSPHETLLSEGFEGAVDSGAARVIRQTRAWVLDVVIRYRLCPFAEGVFKAEGSGVRYAVSRATDTEQLWKDFVSEVGHLARHTREELGTTLLIAPACLGELQDFNEFCAYLEETIEDDEVLVDQVLVACFHPKHAFHGVDEDDAINYEKRSPHPTINLLRADVVDEYVATGKTLGIAEHNERRLRAEGRDAVKAAFEATLAL